MEKVEVLCSSSIIWDFYCSTWLK